MTQDIFGTGVSQTDEVRNEKARRAVEAFRAMQPGLTGYAQALTQDKNVQVLLSEGDIRTDGRKIYFKPPIELGDLKPHQRALCDRRDGRTMLQLCDACRVRETVLISIYHEVAHIVYGTFQKVTDNQKKLALEKAIEEAPGKYAKKIRDSWDKMPSYQTKDYLNLSGLISPFLPILVNAIEDARVDEAMFKARRGTKVMFDAMAKAVFADGIELPDGSVAHWSDRPLNSQIMIGVFAVACKYDYKDWFDPKVEKALRDKRLVELIDRIETLRSAEGSYNLAFPVLARLRELGFCHNPDEEPEDEPEEPDTGDDPGDDEGEEGSGDSDSMESDEVGEESPEGPEEPESGDGDPSDDGADGGEPEEDEASGDGVSDSSDGADEDQDAAGGDSEDDEPAGDDPGDGEGDGSGDSASESDEDDHGDELSDSSGEQRDSGDGADGASDADADPDEASGRGAGDADAQPEGEAGGTESSEAEADDDAGDSEPVEGEGVGTEPADPVDTGEYTEDGAVKDENPDYGTADDALQDFKVFTSHDDEKPPYDVDKANAEDADESAIDRAIIQSMYFEKPSSNVVGVREHRYGVTTYTKGKPVQGAWDAALTYGNNRAYKKDLEEAGIRVDLTIPEQVLGPALGEMRRAFADNQRADMQRHLKSGRVNNKVLGKRAWNGDPRLFQKKRIPGKKNYAVVLGIDISGSTHGLNIVLAKRAAMAQAELCHRLGIDFAIYAHTAQGSSSWRGDLWLDMYEIKRFDEPWNPDTKKALSDIASHAENLDGHGVEYYRKVIERHPATDKIILYYSDGKMPAANHDEELEILQREIRYCKSHNITLMGVGIRTDSPKRHGLDTVRVDKDSDISKVVQHLESALLHNR